MKKLVSSVLAVLVVIAIVSLSTFFSFAATMQVTAAKATAAPNINDGGVLDNCYKSSTKLEYLYSKAAESNFMQKTGSVAYVVWNGDYLYFYISVKDSTRDADNVGIEDYKNKSYTTDCVEIYLDFDNRGKGSVDGADIQNNGRYTAQLRINPYYDDSLPATAKNAGLTYSNKLGVPFGTSKMINLLDVGNKTVCTVTEKSDGYVVEAKIYHGGNALQTIGFGLQSHDDGEMYTRINVDKDYFGCSQMEKLTLSGGYSPSAARQAEIAASIAAMSSSKSSSSKKPTTSSKPGTTSSRTNTSSRATSSKTASSQTASSEIASSQATSSAASSIDAGAAVGGVVSEPTASTNQPNAQTGNTDVDTDDNGFSLFAIFSVWAIVGIAAGVLVIVAGVVVTLILVKNKKAAQQDAQDAE